MTLQVIFSGRDKLVCENLATLRVQLLAANSVNYLLVVASNHCARKDDCILNQSHGICPAPLPHRFLSALICPIIIMAKMPKLNL